MLSDSAIMAALVGGDLRFLNPADGRKLVMPDHAFQPVSVDLRLGAVGPGWSSCSRVGDDPTVWTIPPGAFVLASTFEVVELSHELAATIEGKSSVARRGLQVEAAGLVDPGFRGQPTLEVVNFTDDFVRLTEGEQICQLVLYRPEGQVLRPYGAPGLRSHYQDQRGPTPAFEERS